jgi:hypothetical protein
MLIFLIIPLVRIVPRFLAKRRRGGNYRDQSQGSTQEKKELHSGFDGEYAKEQPQREFSKPKNKNILVLGELNRGSNTFEILQKNTGLGNKELDSILEQLENKGMMKVHKKQGLFGPKIELYPTDKGFTEYYS